MDWVNLDEDDKCWCVFERAMKLWDKYTRGDPKITRTFSGKSVLPSAPAWCVYMTALRISWQSGVLQERSIGPV